ncbi:MAG TPA: threonine aldolase [Spirochaeta sp.]|nr:threonine aldolase [Spirochaeta sp.]
MYSFKNDYSDGGHPDIIRRLSDTAAEQTEGYGDDHYSRMAEALLKKHIGNQNVDIHFITGGTLTNLVAISAFLRPHEAVISAETGHIYVHETGSIEATGHKVFPLDSSDGKMKPDQVRAVVQEHHFEHMVKPKLLYISQSTELGTIYSLQELRDLRELCSELGLFLYLDGARLGSALASESNDLSLNDISDLCDAFYIGGTKSGALFGEALVICNDGLKDEFRYLMKQRGAIFAKGRLLSLQFIALFEDNLYMELGRHANRMADKLQTGVVEAGYDLKFHSSTNQIFPVLPEKTVAALEKKYQFYRWETMEDELIAIRLICSWTTEEKQVDQFVDDLIVFSY